jgi:hypothetical protein
MAGNRNMSDPGSKSESGLSAIAICLRVAGALNKAYKERFKE